MVNPSLRRLAAAVCFFLLAGTAFADELQDAGKLYKGGQYESAMKQVDLWLAKNPNDAKGRFLKGLILMKEGKPDEALSVFNQLTEDYPELPEPYNNLAVIYAARGQYELAKSELESAIAAHPGYAEAHENLGDIYLRLAQQSYEKAARLDESNAGVKEKLQLVEKILSGKGQP